jgi:DNA-binding FrmR family transcriptional regulator
MDDDNAGSHDHPAGAPGTPAPDEVAHDHAAHPGYADHRAAYLARLRRIEGQVRGIARMVDEDVYCIDVLTQISAVTRALQAVSIGLVEDHLGGCVVDAARRSSDEGQAKVKEAADAIARLVRS